MKPTLVEAQSSSGYGKVPYTTSGPPKSTNTGDIRKNGYKNMILEIINHLFNLCYTSFIAVVQMIWMKLDEQSR